LIRWTRWDWSLFKDRFGNVSVTAVGHPGIFASGIIFSSTGIEFIAFSFNSFQIPPILSRS
jgi:hypothetical protein